MKKIFCFIFFIAMMNSAHSFLYVIHDEALNDSMLFTIDSPYSTKVLNNYPGLDLEAIDSHPERWELYAASGDDTEKAGYLYQVNPQNGDLTEIGSTGFREIEGLSFKKDGTLWGWAKGDGLIKVNPQTAESELVLPSDIEMEALTWDNDKTLYLAQGKELWKYDGQDLEFACNISKHTNGKNIEALEMLPNNTLLVGLHGKRKILQLNVLVFDSCIILKNSDIISEHNDIEGIAYTKSEPLHLAKPIVLPNHTVHDILKPNVSTEIGISINVSGGTGDLINVPTLILEEITSEGPIILDRLYDDGTHGDLQIGDYLYTGKFTVQKSIEGEYCYQVRTEKPVGGVKLVSDSDCLWVLSLPTQYAEPNIAIDEGIIVSFTTDTSILRIKEIILAENAMVLGDIPHIRALLITVESEARSSVIERFKKYKEVKLAIPNRQGIPLSDFPNDPKFVEQDSLKQIRANEVFYIYAGTKVDFDVNPDIPDDLIDRRIVAVIDTGVDYKHPDLEGQIIKGKDFDDNDLDPMDDSISGHGTAVASVIAAKINNEKGMVGVSPDSTIYAIKAESLATQIDAIKYASKYSKILNLSYGYDRESRFTHGNPPKTTTTGTEFRQLIKDIDTNKKLLVSAAGNDGISYLVDLPCDLSEVLCVAGTNKDNEIAPASNFSSSVDIVAPFYNLVATNGTHGYEQSSGTSLSSPLVAGAASIIWNLHPLWDADKIKKHLINTAKPIPLETKIKASNYRNKIDFLEFGKKITELPGWSVITGNDDDCHINSDYDLPTKKEKMILVCTTEKSETLHIKYRLDIPEYIKNFSKYGFQFYYSFLTQEYPAGSKPDSLSVWVSHDDDTTTQTTDFVVKVDNINTPLYDDTLMLTDKHITGMGTSSLIASGSIEPPILTKVGRKFYLNFKLENNVENDVIEDKYPYFTLDYINLFISTKTIIPELSERQLDVFEAVFGGSFESKLQDTGWIINGNGTCYTTEEFGYIRYVTSYDEHNEPIYSDIKNYLKPTNRDKFLMCTTHPHEESAWISREIDIPEGVISFPISLDYNFISQEYPGYSISDWDTIELRMKDSNGKVNQFVLIPSDDESMKEGTLYLEPDIIPVGLTGWKTISGEIPVTSGKWEMQIRINNVGSGNNLHSVLLMDNIRLALPE